MSATFWQRDAAYKRRIRLIVPAVLAAYAALFLAAGSVRYEDIPRYVGWRGELELLPEITVVPEVASIEAEPAPREEVVRETVALDLTPRGEVETDQPPPVEAEPKPRIAEAAEGTQEVRSIARVGQRELSYSDVYVILKMVKPVYPPYERMQGIEGNVTVELMVDEYGMVAIANVLSSAGSVNFEQSALDAVRQFLFQPPTENGQPTQIWVRFLIKFRISE
jgi:TonB family protein